MPNSRWFWHTAALILSATSSIAAPRAGKSYDFPIYTNKPAGRQMSGQHAPATTPALPPVEAQKKFKVPAGFEVRLFAAEPEVVNPVAMTWDDRGRLWVVELYEYPLGAKPGEKPRDRIKILEDSDADGSADKVTVFADGLNLATGLLLGDGGAYVGQAPHLLFLQDLDGDDRADKKEILLTGFGLEDRHELLNGFAWGPDGALYMTHGVFTFANVVDPSNPSAPAVHMNAALARFHPRSKRFEVYADGTSNPWGVDFDRYGNAYVSACVIDHFFHLAPGGSYVRQSGVPTNPYVYQLLPSIVDHKHHMAAYAGVNIYQGNQFPAEWKGHAMMGNIHQSALNHDRLEPNGSSFKASAADDFLAANDGWFRPVSTQTGPDGALWIMDWYDKYPCYQNANADPEGVDREHGRIWRVVHTGSTPGAPVPSRPSKDMNLARLGAAELVALLDHPNIWQRRAAQRLLREKKDASIQPALVKLAAEGRVLESRLFAFWTLHSANLLDESILDRFASDPEPAMRSWAARLTGERGLGNAEASSRLRKLAEDADPNVRFSVAVACRQFTSGSLTVNTPPPAGADNVDVGEIMVALLGKSAGEKDPLIPFAIWLAVEPLYAKDPGPGLVWLAESGDAHLPLSGQLARKAMRRLCDMNDASKIDLAVEFLQKAAGSSPAIAIQAIDGLLEGQKGKALVPTVPTANLLASLSKHSDAALQDRGRRLGALWGDAAAILQTIRLLQDGNAALEDRLRAAQSLRQLNNDTAREAMLALVNGQTPDRLTVEVLSALSEAGGNAVPETIVQRWPDLTPAARRAAADTLASRRNWARAFLAAIEKRVISASDLPAVTVRSLVNHRDEYVRNNALRAIGKFREADADKLKLIAQKRKVVLEGTPNLGAGREIATRTCFVCHKFHGEGGEVGPDLTGVGRSSLDALLHNVIHPNEIIGKGYENVEVETKDGRIVSGRLIEDNDSSIKLLASGPKEEVVAKANTASRRVTELSVMPEGLEQMPDEDFRNLIWYILNPPQDKKPLTPERWRELIGDEKPSASQGVASDGESVALWNPEWRVKSGTADGAPRKESEYAGRRNVLMTHPFHENEPAVIERRLKVPPVGGASVRLHLASHEKGDWLFIAKVDGKEIKRHRVDASEPRWKLVEIDLAAYAGKDIGLSLENASTQWDHEFGYWHGLEIVTQK